MQFATIVALFALALGVTAHPGHPPVDVHQQKNECGGGQLACCLEHSDIHADGFLSGLLTEGLLTPIIGSQEQSCAKFSLIENLNILGFTTKKDDDKPSCKSITACCPDGQSCNRV
ncbi:hypothetical protein SI65_08417 [Aspergillus cristatus]|uniref:Hydrophobin n=1 Tax=Aspergillus cristatus TaxID=573508 RepID=A0A1E3B4V5_ASPCR|nr:hypothetical protein SI65_08417 [Aspergillus cristatus]